MIGPKGETQTDFSVIQPKKKKNNLVSIRKHITCHPLSLLMKLERNFSKYFTFFTNINRTTKKLKRKLLNQKSDSSSDLVNSGRAIYLGAVRKKHMLLFIFDLKFFHTNESAS